MKGGKSRDFLFVLRLHMVSALFKCFFPNEVIPDRNPSSHDHTYAGLGYASALEVETS